ncbi:MAG: imidazoleglycerol-phosphate dehydratase HisB [Candidatus Dormibacteraeota bacterium]|uniref:Imidazoleglycerol-phosphate dehydratase n=1 Tax=Candidatus Aeolococcus gillhamiae TaxID=3127015 RepID=A0A2W5Z6E8_9BACT|nr:imidazoleglycerol-phosphate dehydratase HisB [Candidatus Dormibacteraeota bacterium]PZR80939.1 MAG: imidazoleglycerol-phosphate dehydratase HisB [Candidatus Dormibacter sp. RRmetagenome_bin12]
MSERRAHTVRETKETRIECTVTVEGSGRANIELPLPFFRHMIESFVKYSGMDVELSGRGDVEVDAHHLVEDTGLVLGSCVAEALGDRAGIARFGHTYAPLDESLVRCALDYSKRPHVVYEMAALHGRINDFDVSVLHEFVRGYAQTAGISLHLDLIRGDNLHHIAEAAFKALGLATRDALTVIGVGIPSTKGSL